MSIRYNESGDLEEIESVQYDSALDDPRAWRFCAWTLKRAAGEIDTFSLPEFSSSHNRPEGHRGELDFVMPVYRFLMAQSFENLLKGLLVSQGRSAGADGEMDRSFVTHSLSKLVGLLDKTQFDMSGEERETILAMQPYLDWVGRYPIPKMLVPTKTTLYKIAFGYSNTEHARERELWERMFTALKTNAGAA